MPRTLRLLVVDDQKPVALGLQNQLNALGYDVIALAFDGHQAIEACRRMMPDLVIMDIEMPDLDGLSAAREIHNAQGVPVIILTAHGHPNNIQQAVEDGVVNYLLKPATSAGLHAAIQVAIARSRENTALRESILALESSLRDRKVTERAKGILMARRRITEPEAFRYLQRESQNRRVSMAKLAEAIIQADELLDPDIDR